MIFKFKRLLAILVETITGRRCERCKHYSGGACAHPSDKMYKACGERIYPCGFEKWED